VNDTRSATGAAVAGSRRHPGVRADSRLTDELAAHYEGTGAWRPLTLRALLRDAARHRPERVAAVDRGADGAVRRTLTYAELDARAHAYACGLHGLGVREGDGVAVMLPNGADFAALVFAAFELGAVYTGVPASYGEREVAVILRRSRARVVVAATGFGRNRPRELVTRVRPDLPSLRHVVVAGDVPGGRGDDDPPLAALLEAPEVDLPEPDPRALCHVGFTSGTTGEPKGVMNTHQTLRAVLENWVAHQGDPAGLGDPLVNLVASPVGHHTGFLWGVLLTTLLEGTAVYLDRWIPERAPEVIRQEGVTTMFSAPTFLQDLLQTDLVDDGTACSLRTVVLAGAPVPRSLPERAERAFGCRVCPAWGMTELGIGISCAPHLPPEASRTDGVAVPGTEVRVLGVGGGPAAPGELGALQIRGPGLFLGYLDLPAATAAEITPDGWFTTGDTARTGPQGWVEIEGRTKDVVIRGGENIPVAAVESLLYQHPALLEAAVVGVPDPRLGERACAVVVPAAGTPAPTLEDVCAFLTERGLSRHFLPERLESLEALPKTASGKVRKVELRERYG
jgi:cyclohexanecarboxylate-CoA ligase